MKYVRVDGHTVCGKTLFAEEYERFCAVLRMDPS
jgi:hypothetical protein